jgi:GWxTD domain-containing protein
MAKRSAISRQAVSKLFAFAVAIALAAACAGAPPFSEPAAPPPAPANTPANTPAGAPAAKAAQPGAPVTGDGFGPYRTAGMLVQSQPIPFVGSVHYFAGATADSTLALVAVSMANRSLMFTAEGTKGDHAAFTVGIVVRDSTRVVSHTEDQQTIAVQTFKETMRGDETIVFQRYIMVPPGAYQLALTITDRATNNASAVQASITVPTLAAGTLSSPTTVFSATARARRDTLPDVIANPRSTLVFGRDSVAPIYLEAYGLAAGSRMAISVENQDHSVLLTDTVTLTRQQPVAAAEFDLPMPRLGLGRRTLVAMVVGARDTLRSPLFITVGDGIGIVSFDELLSYLRYFATPERLQTLRTTPPAQRGAAWYAFWKETDPNPATADNEALLDYFDRIQSANRQFKEPGEPGWLTDRGKVYITLGEPDQVMGSNGKGLTPSGRSQFWAYSRHGIRLEFVDQTGYGRWRLTQRSEAEFEQVAGQEMAH